MGTYLPPEQRDTSWYLFNELFMCRLPNLQSMSVDYIQHFGMPTSGDASIDYQTANELVVRMLTVDAMLDHFNRGVSVAVVYERDTKRIYELIVDHLNAWRVKIGKEFNIRGAPLEDLVALDAFAGVVYKHARLQERFDQQYVDSLLARALSGTTRVSRAGILRAPDPKVVTINPIDYKGAPAEQKLPEHHSMAELFLNREKLDAGGRKWR